MKIADSQEMKEIDRITIAEYGIPSVVLMERAGLAVAGVVCRQAPTRKVLVLCGGGNNGGDGLAAARILYNKGYAVKAIMVARNDSLSTECALQLRLAEKVGVAVEFRSTVEPEDIHGACVVDAVLGTGLSRPVRGDLGDLFTSLNHSGTDVVSVDIPSGVSADTGEVLGASVRATCTVTFGLPKRGHYLHPGADLTGRLFVEDIGFPRNLTESADLKVSLADKDLVTPLIPSRPRHSYKGTYGHVLVVGGASGKTGAALLAAKAALRSGAGLVTIGVPSSLAGVFQSRVTDEMVMSLPDDGSGGFSVAATGEILDAAGGRIAALAVGPGLGVTSDTSRLVSLLLERCPVPMVIDADGLNSLCGCGNSLRVAGVPVIITPHPGEMKRLLAAGGAGELGTAAVDRDRIRIAQTFASGTGMQVVLKGVPTVVAEPGGEAYVNTTGNPGMATAGAGDVLTGMIASFVGQGLSPENATILGVYLHGLAGDCAAATKGEHSLIASDIIEHIPDAFLSFAS